MSDDWKARAEVAEAEVERLRTMLDRCDESHERVIAERDTLRDTMRRDPFYRAIERALARYDDPREQHNRHGGFPRGELAWAMADDLRAALDGGKD
jgi:hypothetical protein